MRKRQVSFRGFLEMDDGSFYTAQAILASPDLQKRCIEQRELKKIIRLFAKHGIEPSDLDPTHVRALK